MKRLALVSLIIGIALVVVPIASSMVLSDGSGSSGNISAAGSIDPATQAVLLRSQALAAHYTDPATLALIERSKGLSDYYGANGVTFHSDVLGGTGTAPATSAIPSDSSTWSVDWQVIALAAFGAMLLAAASLTLTRRRHRHQLGF